jgi:hypothetical protein
LKRPGASAAQGQLESLARQLADDIIRQREEARRRAQFGKVYQEFDPADDVIRNNVETVTRGMFSGNDGTLVGASEMFTSSLTAAQQSYFYDIYHKDPVTDNTAIEQFSIAYGHFAGSGSLDTTGNLNDDTPSRAIYKQYAQLLLPPNDKKFTFNGTDSDYIYVVNFNRARIREKIDPGNIEFTFIKTPSATTTAATAGTPTKIIDDSSLNANSIGEAGLVYNLVSGSISPTTTIHNPSSPTYFGLLYPQHGIAIFNGVALDTGAQPNFSTDNSAAQNYNHLRLLSSLKGSGGQIQARSSEQVKSSYFFCRLKNAEYNYSNNPSFVTGSLGQLAFNTFIQDPQVYITTVGLYNDRKELLAVAKLSQPLLKSFTREALIKIKLDF